MKKEETRQILESIGFTEWEIEAYIILVKYGPQTALDLSRLSKIARSKTYEVITRLRRKGFVMKVPPMPTKGVTQKFVAIDPEIVFSSKITDMGKLSKYLSSMYKNPIKPRFPDIQLYTSKEAVKELFHNISQNSRFFYFYLVDLNFENILGYSFAHFINNIRKRKHHLHIGHNKALMEILKNVKNFSFHDEKTGINYIITSNSVILDLWKSQMAIIEIKSKEAVKTFLHMYNKMIKDNKFKVIYRKRRQR